jgi:phenylalanyl-tRNA synthetase alpha chain
MREELERIREEAAAHVGAAASLAELEKRHIAYLGRRGCLASLFSRLAEFPEEERRELGRLANEARDSLQALFSERKKQLEASEAEAQLRRQAIDTTLPGRWHRLGHPHPLSLIAQELRELFVGMGFEFVEGPECELYRYNFEMLNYPPEHPAMDEQDSFYLSDDVLLRSQTTAIQGRILEKRKPPLRIAIIGRTHRREAVSVRISHTFHQFDAFAVDRGINFAHLKGTVQLFVQEFFGAKTRMRFRPDFFPFTEPSAEVSVTCGLCEGRGCAVCKYSGWAEIAGCGMIHPNVLVAAGHDPEKFTGWAFGFGLERMAMIRFGIDDIRLFMENDLRFLEQFQ